MRSPFVEEWLRGKTAQDFDVIEHLGGRLLWPVTVHRMRAPPGGKVTWTEERAYLHTLDGLDMIRVASETARVMAERGIDKSNPDYEAIWAEVRMHARVSIALREAVDATGKPYDPTTGHPQKATLDMLLSHKASGITRREVSRLDDVLDQFGRFEDAKRLEDLDKDLVVRVAMAIAEVRNLTPLLAIDGAAQDACVVSMAELLTSYLQSRSSSPSPESSTPAP